MSDIFDGFKKNKTAAQTQNMVQFRKKIYRKTRSEYLNENWENIKRISQISYSST